MENNDTAYYVPELSEFRIGFEFEWKLKHDNVWKNHTLSKKDLICDNNDGYGCDSDFALMIRSEIRVKKLCREDIESLGFVYVENMNPFCDEYVKHIDIQRGTRTIEELLRIKHTETCDLFIDSFGGTPNLPQRWFYGTIKNKSELQVLLKQLGI
jgi:hypothetical protein